MQFDGIVFFVLAIAVGYFFARWKLVPAKAADVLPPVLLNVFFPALLFTSFSSIDAKELVTLGLPTVVCTLIFSLISSLLCLLIFRKKSVDVKKLLRFIGGIVIVLLIMKGLKSPLNALFGEIAGSFARYFLVGIMATYVWPLIFHKAKF